MNYQEFIKSKAIIYQPSGFDCTERNKNLFGWQNDVVRWALRKGKCAIFSDCEQGKHGCFYSGLIWSENMKTKQS